MPYDPTGNVSHEDELHRSQTWKRWCRVATTANITISTGLNAGDVIDGITLAAGDRVLVKDQSTGALNGIYVAGPTPARAFDMDQDYLSPVVAKEVVGAVVPVTEGTANAGTFWRCTNIGLPVIGTTAITFAQWATGGGGGGGSSQFYSVTDYGAVGDGTTDDTTAIEDTFDAADATGGGVIYFPPTADYYKITTLITRSGTSSYHLLGGGTRHAPARVHQATSNTGAFKFAPSSGTANRDKAPLIENLTISGAGAASVGRGIEGTNDLHVRSCFVAGFFEGIYLSGASYYSSIKDTTLTDCDSCAIALVATNNTTIDSCRITGQWGAGTGLFGALKDGIIVATPLPTGFSTRIHNTSVEYFTGDGIRWDGGAGGSLTDGYFETQQSSTGHAHVRLGETYDIQALWIAGNYFQGDGISGFDAIKAVTTTGIFLGPNKYGTNGTIGVQAGGAGNNPWIVSDQTGDTGSVYPTGSLILDPASPPATLGTPALTLGTSNSAGVATTAVRTDATILAFDATAPTTEAIGDSAAVGAATVAARRDHKHGMPAFGSPVAVGTTNADGSALTIARSDHVHQASAGGLGPLLLASDHGGPIVFDDILQASDFADLLYASES